MLEPITSRWEVILVDDGSDDGTYARAVELHRSDARFKVIRLSRNFGHQVALSAGLDAAAGDAVVTMDGDLQHPPEVIPELVARWRCRRPGGLRRHGRAAGRVALQGRDGPGLLPDADRLADIDVPPARETSGSSIARCSKPTARCASRTAICVGCSAGSDSTRPVSSTSSPPRVAGRSKYSTGRMIRLATDAIVGFSDRPLRLALNLGFVVSLVSIVFGLSALVSRLVGVFVVPGWTSIMVLVGVVGGIQLVVIGIIGEYVSRIYDEVKRRPLYVVSRAHGLERRPAAAMALIAYGAVYTVLATTGLMMLRSRLESAGVAEALGDPGVYLGARLLRGELLHVPARAAAVRGAHGVPALHGHDVRGRRVRRRGRPRRGADADAHRRTGVRRCGRDPARSLTAHARSRRCTERSGRLRCSQTGFGLRCTGREHGIVRRCLTREPVDHDHEALAARRRTRGGSSANGIRTGSARRARRCSRSPRRRSHPPARARPRAPAPPARAPRRPTDSTHARASRNCHRPAAEEHDARVTTMTSTRSVAAARATASAKSVRGGR